MRGGTEVTRPSGFCTISNGRGYQRLIDRTRHDAPIVLARAVQTPDGPPHHNGEVAVVEVGPEFVVVGTPVSLQASGRRRASWKRKVADAARSLGGEDGLDDEVALTITYYYDTEAPAVDIDNIIKPIADALTNIAYVDDRQMQAVHCSRIDASGSAVLSSPPDSVLAALAHGGDFVHITWSAVDVEAWA